MIYYYWMFLVGCFMSSGKYFLHMLYIENVNKFNNILQIQQKWERVGIEQKGQRDLYCHRQKMESWIVTKNINFVSGYNLLFFKISHNSQPLGLTYNNITTNHWKLFLKMRTPASLLVESWEASPAPRFAPDFSCLR